MVWAMGFYMIISWLCSVVVAASIRRYGHVFLFNRTSIQQTILKLRKGKLSITRWVCGGVCVVWGHFVASLSPDLAHQDSKRIAGTLTVLTSAGGKGRGGAGGIRAHFKNLL